MRTELKSLNEVVQPLIGRLANPNRRRLLILPSLWPLNQAANPPWCSLGVCLPFRSHPSSRGFSLRPLLKLSEDWITESSSSSESLSDSLINARRRLASSASLYSSRRKGPHSLSPFALSRILFTSSGTDIVE